MSSLTHDGSPRRSTHPLLDVCCALVVSLLLGTPSIHAESPRSTEAPGVVRLSDIPESAAASKGVGSNNRAQKRAYPYRPVHVTASQAGPGESAVTESFSISIRDTDFPNHSGRSSQSTGVATEWSNDGWAPSERARQRVTPASAQALQPFLSAPPAQTLPHPPPAGAFQGPEFSSSTAPRTGPISDSETADDRISLVVRDKELSIVLSMIAEQHGLNVVTGDEVSGRISLTLNNVPLGDALDTILTANGYTWSRKNGILLVSRIASNTLLSPASQGRILRVIPLNYVSADDINRVVKGLLSPVGTSVITETSSEKALSTREEIVIEDLPGYVERIESYIAQVDQPPRQVFVEAHVLQVTLEDDSRHGVNFEQMLRLSGTRVTLQSTGMADDGSSPAFFLGIDGSDLDGLIDVLKTTTDAKTLASPKVMVLNGQRARMQVGASLGYLVTTTTQTSTLQNVDFLDVGVVLDVTPLISQDGRIMMHVKPEVSGGRINPDTGLPDRDTTEVETTLMLNDGQGMVIGGLIKEEDVEIQNKLPIAGDLWLVGRAFQRRTHVRQRNEYIIALVPRIVPCAAPSTEREMVELDRAQTPLFDGALQRVDRRMWEPQLPDAMRDPRRPNYRRILAAPLHLRDTYPSPRQYYVPSVNEDAAGAYGPDAFRMEPRTRR